MIDISNLNNKTHNKGADESGRLSASEWNTLVSAVEELQDESYVKPATGIPTTDITDANLSMTQAEINRETDAALTGKQAALVSGENIKTINGNSLLGSGDLTVGGSDIDTVTVSIDSASGNPSGSGSVSGGTLSLSFSGLVGATGATGPQGVQGPKGDKGDTGATGAQGQKGDKGDTGATGPAGINNGTFTVSVSNTTGIPSGTATVDNGNLSISLSGIKGEKGDQGNTGSSVDYPYELVNNLTTDDATKGLSAAQGKVLGESIVSVEDKVDNLVVAEYVNLLYGASKTSGYVYAHGSGSVDPVESASIYDEGIPVMAGETLYFKNLYPFFCGIKKTSDNTWVAMSNDTTWNMSGEYEVPADGLLYVSINNSAPDHQLLTRDETMYDNDIIESSIVMNPTIKIENIDEKIVNLDGKVDTLNTRVDDAETELGSIIVKRINLLENVDKTSGYVYAHESGNINSVDSASIYNDGIPVVAGETLYYMNLYPFFCGIKKASDNTWVAMSNSADWNASGEYLVPANGLLYISINNAAPNRQLLTRDKPMYDDDEIESSVEINPEMLPGVKQNVFHIGSTREYTTLRAGISEAIRSANSVVYVDAGTYDLTQEFAAEIAAQGTTQYGIKLENGVHVIFSPGAVVNALYQGTVQNVVRYFAPFFSGLTGGGFTLEGLTLYAKNTRYCVHDEMDGANVITRNRYINCKMAYDGSTSPFDYFQNCIGGGTAKHSYVEIVNCYFDTTGTMTDPSTVSYHNANVTGAKSTIIVSNCYFAHGTFRLGYYGPSTLISRAFVNNCSFEVAPLIRAENQTAEIVNWEMTSFMNEIRS